MTPKHWFAVATAFLVAFPFNSKAAPSEPDMTQVIAVCDGKFGLCRYVNRQTKQEVIPARFEQASPFSERLAAVSIDGRYGYIDQRGDVVISPRFDLAGEFYQGLAEVLIGNKTGIINRNGEIVVQPQFQRAMPFTKDVIFALEGEWTPQANLVRQKLLRGSGNGTDKLGLYHVSGYWIRKPDLTRIVIFESDGRGLIWATTGASGRPFGLLASDGAWRVEQQYDAVEPLDVGRALVQKGFGAVSQYGLVDEAGTLAMPMRPWNTFQRSRGWTWAREKFGEKYSVFNSKGETVRMVDGLLAETFNAAIVNVDGRWVGMDRAGNIVPNPRNGREMARCPSGIREIEFEGKVRFVDSTGVPTTPYLFDSNYIHPCDMPLQVKLGDKWGFIGIDGRLLNDPPTFDEVRSFSNGYAGVKLNGRWGVIDAAGRIVLAPKFDNYREARSGLFHVEFEGKWDWRTASGEVRAEPAPRPTARPIKFLDCGHGLRLAERAGKWGIVDSDQNRDVIVPTYRAITCFKDGLAWAPIDSKREWCAINSRGELRSGIACKTISYPFYATHHSPQQFAEDPFEYSVLWTRAFLEFAEGLREDQPQWFPWENRPYSVGR